MASLVNQKIAILGATGNIGREILQVLAERHVPLAQVAALDDGRMSGVTASYGEDDEIDVGDVNAFDFATVDIVINTLAADKAAKLLPKIADDGSLVIDLSGAFRADPDVPMALPEVGEIAAGARNIIACPDSLSTFLALVLKPLHDAAGATRVVASTYQSVSSLGREAMDELFSQTRSVFVNDPVQKEHFAKQIAFNVIPHTAPFRDDGLTETEFTVAVELKKLIAPKLKLAITAVFVPAFLSQGVAATIEFERDMDGDTARKILKNAPGISVVDLRGDEGFVTLVEASGEDKVYVSRIRDDATTDNGVSLWIVGDNLRKGSALNAVQIAEAWAKRQMH